MQPVLNWSERLAHPHLAARGTFVEVDGVVQPAPAPRLSRTPGSVQGRPPHPGEHTRVLAAELGLPAERVQALLDDGVLAEGAS